MHLDVVEFEQFYKTQLGHLVQRSVRARLRQLWPIVEEDSVLGLGFPNPVMTRYGREARRAIVGMPAGQGADWWQPQGKNATAMMFENELPFPDLSFDRIVALHLLENTEDLTGTLEEIWRVLSPEGRFVAIVPNRASLWARMERTPFGHGRPFSGRQLVKLLCDLGFSPENHTQALFFPPSKARIMLRLAGPWERLQTRMLGQMGGVHVIEVVKHVHGVVPSKGARSRIRLPVARPVLRPAVGRNARLKNSEN